MSEVCGKGRGPGDSDQAKYRRIGVLAAPGFTLTDYSIVNLVAFAKMCHGEGGEAREPEQYGRHRVVLVVRRNGTGDCPRRFRPIAIGHRIDCVLE